MFPRIVPTISAGMGWLSLVSDDIVLVEEPTMDGFFRYPHNFTFAVLGFYIVCMLGQIRPRRALRRRQTRLWTRKRRIISLVLGVITSVVNIVLIVGGFSDDRISFMCLSVISIVIILYKRWVFDDYLLFGIRWIW
jgi:hypothetical protein